MNLEVEKTVPQDIEKILASISDAFCVLDCEWRYTYVNNNAAEIVGIQKDELLGRNIWELFPDTINSIFYTELHRAVAEQVTVNFEYFYAKSNRWFENRVYPSADGVLIFTTETTERKRAQQHLAAQFRLIAENSTDIISLHTVDGILLYVSPAFYTILGYRPEEFVGRPSYELIHPDDLAEIAKQYPVNADLPDIYTITHRVRHKNGHYVWLEATVRAIHDPQSREVLELQASSRDITERKQAEERLRLLAQEAQDSQQAAMLAADRTARLQAVTAALSESLTPAQVAEVIVEQGMAALRANSALVASLTTSGTELEIIRTFGFNEEIVDEWRQFSIHASVPLAEAVRTGKPVWSEPIKTRIARYPHLAQNYCQCNYGAWISIPFIVEKKAIGGLSLAFCEFQEFSQDDRAFILALAQQCAQAIQRAQLYEAEQKAREAAEAANRIKDEFLAVLSHELRSPLSPILGWTKLLRKGKLDQKMVDRALETIERNVHVQTQLIEDLLDVSRIIQGKLSLNICPIDLASTIQAAIETVRLSAEAKSIDIHAILDPGVSKVRGDSSRLQQIVWNLLSNAVKFTPSGGRVDIRLENIESDAQIVVTDTGKGINSDFLPYVFDYFRQENSTTTRKFGGLGLGLAIVRHLVELHGGTVQVESRGENQGATFIVRLPLMATQGQTYQDGGQPDSSLDLKGIKILVVDDDTDTREYIAFLLEQYRASVTAVRSANEALAAFTQLQPDVILSDIGMPEVDGYTLLRQLRTLPPERGGLIPAIALTAYAGEINEKQAFLAGFQQHISKPLEPDKLVEAIANLVLEFRISN